VSFSFQLRQVQARHPSTGARLPQSEALGKAPVAGRCVSAGTYEASTESVRSMEDIVAARVRDNSGKWYGFMTWGRIVDHSNDSWVEEVVRASARECAIPDVDEVHVCGSLSEAATCQYFYEGLFHFTNLGIPFGTSYEAWRQDRLAEFEQGTLSVYFLGPEREAIRTT
jgi:hypothetical protein